MGGVGSPSENFRPLGNTELHVRGARADAERASRAASGRARTREDNGQSPTATVVTIIDDPGVARGAAT